MLWRKGQEPESAEPLPDSGPNDPRTIGTRPQTPEEKAGTDAYQREVLEEHERRVEEGEPPDYEHT